MHKSISEWAVSAKWPPCTASGAGGIAQQICSARISQAVYQFTMNYRETHDHFPVETHDICEEVGDAEKAERCRQNNNNMGVARYRLGCVKVRVQYPDD